MTTCPQCCMASVYHPVEGCANCGYETTDQTPPRDHERERMEIAARIASPKRSVQSQQDVNDCPLFVAANEPRLI